MSFLLLPIYTAYIIPSEWGILNLLIVSSDLTALIISCQLPVALYRFWSLSQNEGEKRHLSGLTFVSSVVSSSVVFVPLFIFAERCASFLGIDGHGDYVRVLLITTQLAMILNIIQAEMRVRNEAKYYAFLDIGQNFGQALINIFLVAVMGWGIWGILVGQLLTFAVIVSLLFNRFYQRTELNFDKELLKRLFAFSLPLVPSAVAMAAIHSIDRYFIQFISGPTEVGLYSIGYKFGTLVNILILGPFLLIWEPRCYDIAKRPDASRQIGKVLSYLTALMMFVTVGTSGAAKEIVNVMTSPAYHAAWKIIPLVAFSYVLFGLDSVVRVGLLVHHKTKTILAIVLVSCAVNIVGNAFLVPTLGMMGAALATVFAFCTLFFLDLGIAQMNLPVRWEWKRIAIICVTSILVLAMMLCINSTNILFQVCSKLAILALYPVLLFVLGFFDKGQKEYLMNMIMKIKNKVYSGDTSHDFVE